MFYPVRWKNFPRDFIVIQIGFALFGLSIATMIRSNWAMNQSAAGTSEPYGVPFGAGRIRPVPLPALYGSPTCVPSPNPLSHAANGFCALRTSTIPRFIASRPPLEAQ